MSNSPDSSPSQLTEDSPYSHYSTDTKNNTEIGNLHEHLQSLTPNQKDKVIKSFISDTSLDINIKKKHLATANGADLFSVKDDTEVQSDDTASDSEDNTTPRDVVEIVTSVNSLTRYIDNLTTKELADSRLTQHLSELYTTLDGLVGNDNITTTDLKGILNPDEINESNKSDDMSDVSDLSRTTITIMQHPNIVGTKGNVLVATKDRNTNIKKIIDSMLENDFKRQMIMAQGSERKLRVQFERGFDTDKQFSNVWGSVTNLSAKKKCCYLCGGDLITVDKVVSPEMEHKLPSLEFYTKVHNINQKHPNLLMKWTNYVDKNPIKIQTLYNNINCNLEIWSKKTIDKTDPIQKVADQIAVQLKSFQTDEYLDEQTAENKEFIALLKIHLMEFAYSHHTCNQIKENDNLNTPSSRTKYLNNIHTAVTYGSFPTKGLLNTNSLLRETQIIRDQINNQVVRNNRNVIIGSHMDLMKTFIEEYAVLFEDSTSRTKQRNAKMNYLLKKIMTQSIKDTLNYVIGFKQNEKNKKLDAIRAQQDRNDTEQERKFLAFLNEITLNKQAILKTTSRGKETFYKSKEYGELVITIRKEAFLNRLTEDDLKDIKLDKIYDNLIYNSDLGDKLVKIYNTNKYPFLNDDIALYFSDRLNDKNTAGDGNDEDPDQMEQASNGDRDSVNSRNSSDMAVSSDDGRESGDEEVAKLTDRAAAADAAREEQAYQMSQGMMIPIPEKPKPVKSRQRLGTKTPPLNPVSGMRTRSKSANILQDQLQQDLQGQLPQDLQGQRRRSQRLRPNSTINFGGKRKTNKMRRKQTPKRSMRRKTKNTRSSRKRTHRKTNTNKHTHTRRRR